MNDMSSVIVPKSDQLNADSLLSGPRTITITKVEIRPNTEQPVSIFYEGDEGKPYKCCKSMARVLVHCWGPDANKYIGRSLTLYCDPKVLWGGMAVGGIRISHMTDISSTHTMALTATKGSKKPFTVQPLVQAAPTAAAEETFTDRADRELTAAANNPALWVDLLIALTVEATTAAEVVEIRHWPTVRKAEDGAPIKIRTRIREAFDAAMLRLAPVSETEAAADTGEAGEAAA